LLVTMLKTHPGALAVVLIAVVSTPFTEALAGTSKVVVVTDGPVPDQRVTPFLEALREVSGSQIVLEQDIPVVEGDWTRDGILAAFDEAYAQAPDLVLALGIGASSVALGQPEVDVPTVAPWVLDPVLQGLTGELPGNVYPVRVHLGLQGLAQTLRDVADVEHVAVLADPLGVALLDLEEAPSQLEVVTLTQDPQNWLGQLPEHIEGVLVGPLGRFDEASRAAIAAELMARGLPSLTLAGTPELEHGFMMSRVGLGDLTPLARSSALLSVSVLQGRGPQEATWTPANSGALALRMETVDRLGVAIPFDVLTDATLVGGLPDAGPPQTMEAVVSQAIEQSPALQAQRAEVDAAQSDLVRSWSSWMPQVGVSAQASFVDTRVTEATLGLQPSAALGVEGVIRQLIYDVQARANVPVQQRLQAGRVARFEAQTLDLVSSVMTAYIDAIRADALLDVREADLRSLQAHLEAARVRVAVGDATDAEEARWLAEIAQARATLVDGYVRRRIARMQVNQLMGRDPGQQFAPDPEFADQVLGGFGERVLGRSLDNPVSLKRLADALVTLGIQRSPELAQLELGIEAQEAWLTATRQTYFIPTLGAQVSGTYQAWRSGGSGTPLDAIGLPDGVSLGIPEMPDVYGAAGVSASLPIFEGRARKADQAEAAYDLEGIRSTHTRVEQQLTLRIRAAVLNLEARNQRVEMSRLAIEGAERNLDWAEDAYARGLATQVQLLDARSEVLQARLALTDARFEMLAAIVELERSIAALSYPGGLVDPAAIDQAILELIAGDAP